MALPVRGTYPRNCPDRHPNGFHLYDICKNTLTGTRVKRQITRAILKVTLRLSGRFSESVARLSV